MSRPTKSTPKTTYPTTGGEFEGDSAMGITVGRGVFVGDGVTDSDIVGVHEGCGVAVGGVEGVGDGVFDGWGKSTLVVGCGVAVAVGWGVHVAVGNTGAGPCGVEVGCGVIVAAISSPTTPNVSAYVTSPLTLLT
jgi:hypothetical protein